MRDILDKILTKWMKINLAKTRGPNAPPNTKGYISCQLEEYNIIGLTDKQKHQLMRLDAANYAGTHAHACQLEAKLSVYCKKLLSPPPSNQISLLADTFVDIVSDV